MEFIKLSEDRYLIKNSNSIIVSKSEMLKLKKRELVIKDVQSNECQGETTQKIEEIDKELKEDGKRTKSNTVKKTSKSV